MTLRQAFETVDIEALRDAVVFHLDQAVMRTAAGAPRLAAWEQTLAALANQALINRSGNKTRIAHLPEDREPWRRLSETDLSVLSNEYRHRGSWYVTLADFLDAERARRGKSPAVDGFED